MKPEGTKAARKFSEAMSFLASFTDYEQLLHKAPARTTFDLGRLERLLAGFGNPHHERPVVHVTGTKGKSSVVCMTEALLRAHGLSTFRFLSPHVERVHERLAVNGREVDDATFAALVDELRPAVAAIETEAPQDLPSFFEAMTVMGFLLARRAATDVSVLEVGLGGRLDATNVVDPVVSLITSVGLDHVRILGDTITAIALEKAGIIKPGRPAATLLEPGSEAFEVVLARARDVDAPLFHPGRGFRVERFTGGLDADGGPVIHFDARIEEHVFRDLRIRAGAGHQARNAVLALFAARTILQERGGDLVASRVRAALDQLHLPARAEWFPTPPPVLMDGAHTRESCAALAEVAERVAAGRPIALIVALTRDRDPCETLSPLVETASWIAATEIPTPRTRPAEEVAAELERLSVSGVLVLPKPEDALRAARRRAGRDGMILVAGSLYLAGALRPFVARR